MTPTELQFNCTHTPYFQKGCIGCNVRKLKLYRPDRKRQNAFLADLPEHEREQTIEAITREKRCD